MKDAIPQGWQKCRLQEIFTVRTGGTPSRKVKEYFVGGKTPWVKTGEVQNCDIVATGEFITEEAVRESNAKVFPVGTILVALYGEGKTRGQVGRLTFPAATNQACAALINTELPKETNQYVFLYLLGQYHQLRAESVGGNQPNLNLGIIKEWEIALAPFPEQQRIVAKLETLLVKVDASQQRLTKIPILLKRFRQSVLATACSGRLTADWREENPNVDDASGLIAELERIHEAAGGHKKGNAAQPSDEAHDLSTDDLPSTWRLTEMRSVVCPDRPITYGILKPGPETPGGIPYVRVADFPNDRLNLETIRRTTKEIEKTFARARLRTGDILLSIRGTVGRVCVVPQQLKDANITQDTARLSVQPALNADFVKWFLRAAPTQKRMQKAIKGVAVRGINIGDVRALQMPVPPLPEQQEIVRRVEGLFALADQLELRLAKARGQVERLTPSLLARAFAGQLVPQNANDESAEKLLERIRERSESKSG